MRANPGIFQVTAALCLTMAAACRSTAAASADPWQEPAFARRAVFTIPEQDALTTFVVRIPGLHESAAAAGAPVRVRTRQGDRYPARFLFTETEPAALLVSPADTAEVTCAAYFDLREGRRPPAQQPIGIAPRDNVRVTVFSGRGRGVPNTWAKLLYLHDRAGSAAAVFYQAAVTGRDHSPSIEPVNRPKRRRSKATEPYLIHMQSLLACETAGVYQFAVKARDAVGVRIDGEPAAAWLGPHPTGDWKLGRPRHLERGVHALEVLHFTPRNQQLRLGWRRPGQDAVEPIPAAAFLAAAELPEVRVERMDHPIHAAFEITTGDAYAFRGRGPTFVPVTCHETGTHVLAPPIQWHWQIDGEPGGSGRVLQRILSAGRIYEVTLTIRDRLGFVDTCRRALDLRHTVPRPATLHAAVRDLPACLYAGDPIAPHLVIEGALPRGTSVDAKWRIIRTDGTETVRTETTALPDRRAAYPLTTTHAGRVAGIAWSVEHAGVALISSTIDFLRPPFAQLPAQAVGDALYADSRRLVLLPFRWNGDYRQPELTTAAAFGTIACLDDSLLRTAPLDPRVEPFHAILARIVDGPDWPRVHYHRIPAWTATPQTYGPLQIFPTALAALRDETDVVICSLGLADPRHLENLNAFERRIAALTDLLSATMGKRVLWVTPPPFEDTAEAIRPYAAVIREVADARGIPVADCFSAFLGRSAAARRTLFAQHDTALSAEGHDLAAQVLARALLGAGEGRRAP